MRFQFSPNGQESLETLDSVVQERILKKLIYWIKTPNPLRYAEPLEGYSKFLKYRVGDFRIIVLPKLKQGLIDILRVGPRGNVYKHLEKLL